MAYTESARLLRRASAITASNRSDLEGTYPFVLDRGCGCRVWDRDGNRYIDFTAASGAILLGYLHAEVTDAAVSGLHATGGLLPTTVSEVQVRLAERIGQLFPCAERVLFFKTGSCATTATARLARMFTKRRMILTSGYHGWHDWHLHIFPRFRWPDPYTIDFMYNLNILEALIDEHRSDVAAIFITPEPNFFDKEYFQEVAWLCRSNGILLAFDEVVSGFRYGAGGFAETLGVRPDLMSLAKGLANGFALSAVVGRADIVAAREHTHLAGTFHHEQLPMFAAEKTLEIFTRDAVSEKLARVGERLRVGIEAAFDEFGVRATAFRHPALFHILFDDEDLAQAVYSACYERGLLLHRFDAQMVTVAHREEDIDEALSMFRLALASVREKRPNCFDKSDRSISRAALDYRTLHEFGGFVDYRRPARDVPREWSQDDR